MKIIFVCSGNTCRSPMAEALLRSALVTRGSHNIEVDSAGISCQGERASAEAVRAMQNYGLDINFRMSKQLDGAMIRTCGLVLTMTNAQKQYLLEELPGYEDIIFTLGEFCGTGEEVADPYRMGYEEYVRCADQLDRLTQCAAEKLSRE
ncbi:MAG: low molecular weight protein arginine phosphatase [Eubacteriales bacterium]|nr:low molecular weight protein arginine phosphatase [Eubacteriales bacterium]